MDLAGFRAGEVPTLSVGAILDPADGSVLPALVLDPSDRPDVADLVRVQAAEGVGDLRCGLGVWDLGPPETWLVRLEVAVDHPVRCHFHTVIDWTTHRVWLDSVAGAGAVALGTGDAEGRWLVLNVDPERLTPLLTLGGDAVRDGASGDEPEGQV